MSLSLRDQLLKAGLVNEKQVKQATKQQQKQTRLEKKNQVEKDESLRQAALQAVSPDPRPLRGPRTPGETPPGLKAVS